MEEFTKFEDKSEFKISIISFLYRLLFFNPILDSTRKKDIKYIFVQVSAIYNMFLEVSLRGRAKICPYFQKKLSPLIRSGSPSI